MTKPRYLLALGALSAVLGACGASESRTQHGAGGATSGGTSALGGAPSIAAGRPATATGGTAGASPSGGNTATGGGAGGSAGAGASSGMAGSAGTDTCTPGIPTTSQVPRMKNAAYDNVMRDLLGVTTLTSAAGKKPSELLAADSADALSADAWRLYQDTASTIAQEVMSGSNKTNFITCDAAAASCLSDTIKSFGRKAFRRPLTDTEVTSFLRLNGATPPGTPDEVAEAILYTFLASPSFLMLSELGSDKEGDAIKLTSDEVATRLSFLLWNSVPDGALSDAADNGQLETKPQILAQAQRMLSDTRAQTMLIAFGRYYLGVGNGSHWLNGPEHDPAKYPAFTSAVVAPMLGEIDSFFQDVSFGGGSFADLFLSRVGFVNRDTAPLYGLDPTPYGSDLTRVELDANQRPGLLTRVGFLSNFSHYDITAPVLRGAFVETRVLGVDPGPPPPSVAMLPPPGDYKTEREAVEALTYQSTPCSTCHHLLNPPGFVLEHYDAIGGWQDVDPLGGPIDGTDDVFMTASDTKTITSPLELMQALAASAGAQRRFAEQLVSYATGRDVNPFDACTVDKLSENLSHDGYAIRDLFADYTQVDSFRLRTVGN